LNYDQTVLASIVLQTPDMNNPFHVVAFGVGTKVLSAEVMCLSRMDKFPSYHEIVRDCHAEVLARRSFIAYLHSITKLQLYKLNNQFFKEDIESIHFPFEMTSEGLFKLRDGYSFHFYTSSQPCGNATIKRWAKCKKSRQYDLPIHTYPQSLHDHLPVQLTAIKEGQTALFVKNNYHNDSLFQDSNLLKNASKNFIELAMTSNTSHTKELSIVRMDSSLIPSGLSLVNARKGCIMSCSDKIAKWNTLGWQGALLSNIFEPIYMSTIIVGRKFSKAHCERAFCCRI
jgi:double-stranded RNA-specific adenosine deaminase